MSVLRVWPVLVLAAVLAACSGDEPAAVPEAQPQAVQVVQVSEAAAEEETQEQTAGSVRAEDVEPAVEAVEAVSEEVEGDESAAAVAPTREEARESESRATEGDGGSAVAEESVEQVSGKKEVVDSPQEEALQTEAGAREGAGNSAVAEREVEEEPAEELTDVAGVVVADADVRVRPGLAWPMVDRVAAGEPVVVLHGGGGWYRISYGDGLAGWIRSTAVDLGGVDEWSVLRQAAPAILAEWRGVEYGVMGQSADGAEVRLLAVDDELSEILGAPKDEVRLLAEDVTLEDLPILIGDETVVFPGDDFRVGQGRILPRSDQWLWLDDGSLLAHNETHVWRWQPETDELEYTPRAPGFAKFSPDGRYMAIADLCPLWYDCSQDRDVTIVPLDGTTPISLNQQLSLSGFDPTLWWVYAPDHANLEWSADSSAVKLFVAWSEDGREDGTSIVLRIDGGFARFDDDWEAMLANRVCKAPFRYVDAGWNWWHLSDDNTIATDADCETSDGEGEYVWVKYTLDGEFIELTESSPWRLWDHGGERVRSATDGDVLNEEIGTTWSTTEEHALVVDYATASAWIYEADQRALLAVAALEDDPESSRLWEARDTERDLRHFYMLSSWQDHYVGAVIVYSYIIRAILVIDAESRIGHFVDPGEATWYPDWHRSQGWSPDGTMYHIASVALDRVDGLGALVFQHLIVNSIGTAVAALHSSTDCAGPGPPGCATPGARWSTNDKWFAVSGRE